MPETINLEIEELLDIVALLAWEHGKPRINSKELEQHTMEVNLDNLSNTTVKLEMWVNMDRNVIEIISSMIKDY